MTAILSKDIDSTIDFFNNECTDEELYWLGPVFEDVAEKTQSTELISTLRDRLAKVSAENYKQDEFQTDHMRKWVDYATYIRDINMDIEYAEARIVDNAESDRKS